MAMNPRLAWKHIRLLTGGTTVHHKKRVTMAMKMENGRLTSNAKENMSVFGPHFERVYNNHRPVDLSILDEIPQRPPLLDIDSPITFEEVNTAINKLKNGKSPGVEWDPARSIQSHELHNVTTSSSICFGFLRRSRGLQRMAPEPMRSGAQVRNPLRSQQMVRRHAHGCLQQSLLVRHEWESLLPTRNPRHQVSIRRYSHHRLSRWIVHFENPAECSQESQSAVIHGLRRSCQSLRHR